MRWVSFGEVLEIKNGRNQKRVENPNGRYPIYGSGGIIGYANECLCDAETIVLGRKGSINNPIFVEQPFWNVDTAFGLCANKDYLHPKYLYYFCQQFDFERLNTTVTIPSLTKTNLLDVKLPLPSLVEQFHIVAILDKAETIRRKRQQALELTDELLKSVYSKLCGHKNKEYSKWPFFTVADLSKTMFTGPFGSALRHSEFISEGIPVLGIDNAVNNSFQWGDRRYISEKKYASLKKYTVQHDDVIVTIMGTTGKSAVIPSNIGTAISTKHLATIRLNTSRALPKYLSCSFFLNQDVQEQIYKEGKGAVMPGLNLGIIKSIRLRLPPMENQKNFLHISSKLDGIKKRMQCNLQEACCSIKSLQQFFFK